MDKTHVYIVHDSFSGLRLERLEVKKETVKMVILKKPYIYRTHLPKDKVFWTAEGAVADYIERRERLIATHQRDIQILKSQIGQMPHLLKTFEAALEEKAETSG